MRRALLGLAVTTFTVLALAGPASAAPGQVTQVRFHGTFAEAHWFTSSATSSTDTFVNVSKSMQGSELFVDQFTANFDANGNFTGATDTSADVTSGFSFAIQPAAGECQPQRIGPAGNDLHLRRQFQPDRLQRHDHRRDRDLDRPGANQPRRAQRSFQVRRVQCDRPLQRDRPRCHGHRDRRRPHA